MSDHEHPSDVTPDEEAAQYDDGREHDIPADGGYEATATGWDPVELLRQAIEAGDLPRARTLIDPVWHEREGLRRLVAAYERPPLLVTSTGTMPPITMRDCGCPPNHICGSSACPRGPRVTC